jgi:general secretion pathway protein J
MSTRATTRRLCPAPAYKRARGLCSGAGRRGDGRPPATRGFTLLEILVALSVLGLILGAVYGSYRAVTSSIADLQPRVDLDQKGRFFVQRFSRQIRCCYAGSTDQTTRPVQDQNDVSKSASQEEIRFFQGGRTLSDDSVLQFVTSSSTLNRRSDVGYLAVVSYKMDALQHALLTREEIYGRRSVSEDDEDWRLVLDDVLEAGFEYFDGSGWRKEWDSNAMGGLPKAVRIKLVLASTQDGAPASFTVVAAIRCRVPEKRGTQVQETVDKGKDRAK